MKKEEEPKRKYLKQLARLLEAGKEDVQGVLVFNLYEKMTCNEEGGGRREGSSHSLPLPLRGGRERRPTP